MCTILVNEGGSEKCLHFPAVMGQYPITLKRTQCLSLMAYEGMFVRTELYPYEILKSILT